MKISGVFKKCFLLFLILLALPKISLGEGKNIRVAAAADLSFALKEISAAFEKETGSKVTLSFGSTGMLARQIEEGAPFDVFFSADAKYIEDLKNKGFIIPESLAPYAEGRIVIAVNKKSGLRPSAIKDLVNADFKKIAIANPEHAPYGKAAVEALKKEGVYDKVKDRLVYGENVRQALQFVQTGNAEAGIIALSVADVPEIIYSEIPSSLHNPIKQVCGAVKSTKANDTATAFLKYVNGPKGRPIMKKYGFRLPG